MALASSKEIPALLADPGARSRPGFGYTCGYLYFLYILSKSHSLNPITRLRERSSRSLRERSDLRTCLPGWNVGILLLQETIIRTRRFCNEKSQVQKQGSSWVSQSHIVRTNIKSFAVPAQASGATLPQPSIQDRGVPQSPLSSINA